MAASREQRRRAIRRALRRCMRERGYAGTSLADVARAADMSPSHLLYYFKNKDAILEYSMELSGERILSDMREFERQPVPQRLDALVDYFFAEHGLGKSEVGLMLEVWGIAVHHKALHQNKVAFDREFKAWLERCFETPAYGLRPAEAAEQAYAAMVGLSTSAFFDEELELSRAGELARVSLRRLAGLPSESGAE